MIKRVCGLIYIPMTTKIFFRTNSRLIKNCQQVLSMWYVTLHCGCITRTPFLSNSSRVLGTCRCNHYHPHQDTLCTFLSLLLHHKRIIKLFLSHITSHHNDIISIFLKKFVWYSLLFLLPHFSFLSATAHILDISRYTDTNPPSWHASSSSSGWHGDYYAKQTNGSSIRFIMLSKGKQRTPSDRSKHEKIILTAETHHTSPSHSNQLHVYQCIKSPYLPGSIFSSL